MTFNTSPGTLRNWGGQFLLFFYIDQLQDDSKSHCQSFNTGEDRGHSYCVYVCMSIYPPATNKTADMCCCIY